MSDVSFTCQHVFWKYYEFTVINNTEEFGKYYGLAFSDLSSYTQKSCVSCCANGHIQEKRLAKIHSFKTICINFFCFDGQFYIKPGMLLCRRKFAVTDVLIKMSSLKKKGCSVMGKTDPTH